MKKFKVWSNLGLLLFFLIALVVKSPNLNPLYADGAFAWLFIISAFVILNLFGALSGVKVRQDDRGVVKFDVDKSAKGFKKLVTILAVMWGLYFVVNFASSPLFNSSAYRDQQGTPEVTEFSSDIQPVDLSQVPIVDMALAYSLADKKLGENPGMGSQVKLGEPVIQQVNGELMWVVPLEHSGLFKWLNNMDGSAGYIKVSATNLQDIEFVEAKIKYQPGSYLFDDINRHVRIVKGQLFTGLTDYSFEIDDEGVPHWIITTYKNNWLFSLPEATGVLILNATTGDIEEYSIDDVPEWVDRVQPEQFIMQQINNQGEYVRGIFNFSNKDKYMTSPGGIIVYNEGNCYLFTGMTSVGADESAIGFIMVDMVTKESKYYQMPGATEKAAQRSAEGKVQQYGYRSTFPIIINHNGLPTYFMTLKDDGGLIKQYAFVSVSDITSVGAGETIGDALKDFNKVLGSTNSFIEPEGEEQTIKSKILRIASEGTDGNLVYKLILEDDLDSIFLADFMLSEELALSQVGDTVTITYFDTDSTIITVSSFDNNKINS